MKQLLPLVLCTVLLAYCRPAEQKASKEEAAAFAKEMETAVLKRRPNILGNSIIIQALADRIAREKKMKDMDDVERGIAKGFKNSDFDKNLYALIGENGSFEKVKQYEKDGTQRIIFRAYGDGGMNYFDMEITKLEGKVGIADMFVYASGENISKSLALFVNTLIAETSETKAEQTAEAFDGIKRLMAKKNYEQAKKEFDMLPAYIRGTKVGDMLNLQISSELDEGTYIKEIEKIERKYSGEPGVQLILIDLYFLRKEYNKALGAINAVDSMIDKDPFLDYYRGLLYNVKEESGKAIGYFENVTKSNPGFPGAYAELVAHYLEKNDNEKAALYFSKYKGLRNASQDLITTYESLYPFLKE